MAGASLVGTTIEFYDFFIYGTAAALVFGPLFFPALGESAGTVASFATFGVAFFFRPLGAIFFGHLGDRLGRKKTLVATLTIMGVSTAAIGVVPTAATWGWVAPVLLVVLRAAQGVAVGGEWAGAALLTAEYAPAHKRGFYGMFPQLGAGIAMALSGGTFLAASLTLSPADFASWGWRIPFLLSGVLLMVGLYIRLKIEETPAFTATRDRDEIVKLPIVEAVRFEWRRMLLAGGALTMSFGFFYVVSVYLTSYAGNAPGVGVLGLTRTTVLVGGSFAGLLLCATVVASARAADTFGRKRVVLVGTVASIFAGPLAFLVMEPGNTASFVVGIAVLVVPFGIPYGCAATLLPELFRTKYRYTGAGMGYNLAGILGGAIPLIIAPSLTQAYGGMGVGMYLAALGVISSACVLAIPETQHVDICDDAPRAAPADAVRPVDTFVEGVRRGDMFASPVAAETARRTR
ncbi:MFS transporter [Nocardioides sp. LHG3406-4]|uniref:MFS transporter n=1 Tax=Nocardioides sp. LHG3406-4 TaxID=2804575 RepID=UPI003CE99DEF